MRSASLRSPQTGFALPELLVAVFILGMLTIAIVSLATLGTRTAFEAERQTVGLGLMNQRIEQIRAISYDQVGYNGALPGEPDGVLLKSETYQQNNQPYTINTIVTLVDDPLNGAAGTLTEANADYKKVEITIIWRQANNTQRDVTAVTYVSRGASTATTSSGFSPLPTVTPPTPTPSQAGSAPPCTCPDGSACLADNTCCATCLTTGCPAPETGFSTGGLCYYTTWTCNPGATECPATGAGCVASTSYYACFTPLPTPTPVVTPTPFTSLLPSP